MDISAILHGVARNAQALLPAPGTPLLVAVSGGADSLALLAILLHLQHWPLQVAHMDHGLRANSEAAADVAAIKGVLEHFRRPIALHCRKLAVREWAQAQRLGIEEAARELRYNALRQLAEEQSISVVLTGHHADDQAETIVHNVLRGCGPVGQWGMAASRQLAPNIVLLRPLLHLSRQECQQLLQHWGLSWHEDTTNTDTTFRRNWLRHCLLPQWQAAAPGFSQALCHWASQERARTEPLWRHAQAAIAAAASSQQLLREDLRHMARSQRWLLWRALAEHLQLACDRSWCHHCDDLIWGHAGRQYQHGRWWLRASRSHISWLSWDSALPGHNQCQGSSADDRSQPATWQPVAVTDIVADPWQATLDADRVVGQLVWRKPVPGERWQPLGAQGRRLLKRGLADRGVPAWQRPHLRIVADQEGVVWVPGWTIAQRVRIDQHTRQALRLHTYDATNGEGARS